MDILWLRFLHLLGAILLFGTGLGTAFQFWMAHRSGDARAIAVVARNSVLADWLFTTPAILLQPLTGAALAVMLGYALTSGWILATLLLYGLAGACWLPVVALQIRMARLARQAVAAGKPLPPEYHHAARLWFRLGWPAFAAVLLILHLMIWRPGLW
jgi:uncharacterized membrane protein